MKFTKAQLEAIQHRDGNLQLVACAGSGKTEVVARRVAELLRPAKGQLQVVPANIVAFTFTEKAAAELKDRIYERCREILGSTTGLAEMYVGTIHAFCLDLLKREVPEYLKYEVLNEVQQQLFIQRSSKKSGLTLCTDLAGKTLHRYKDARFYSAAMSLLQEIPTRKSKLTGCSIVEGLGHYQALLREKGFFDYSSILREAADTLATDKALRARLKTRLRHVIVDEYQDVNPVQEEVIRHLHELGAHVCVVGDDDQTIYQWRGSDVRQILTFTKRYRSVREIRLEENFRSSEGIVKLAHWFIKQNHERLDKEMKPTAAQAYEKGDLVGLEFADPQEEADYIARTCKALHGVAIREDGSERGIAWSDMAILLRSVRKNGAPIMQALRQQGIDFLVVGMDNLFESAEAEAARQLFYFLAEVEDVSDGRVLEAWQAARTGATTANLKAAIRAAAKARSEMTGPNAQRYAVYNLQRQYLAFLELAKIREQTVPKDRSDILFYNLGKFSQVISDFETINFHSKPKEKYTSFANFLKYHADGAYPEGQQDNAYANPDAVRIMTVHQAKGLQWPAVFLPQLAHKRFPSGNWGGRKVWHLLPKEAFSGHERYDGSIEDERRLFYVAMTRAQKFLHMTWAPSSRNFKRVSEFFTFVSNSNHVSGKAPSYKARRRLPATPKASVANVSFSFSDIKYFFECPYQFKLRILYGFNPPLAEALGYGKSLHDMLAEVHQRALRGDFIKDAQVPALIARHLRVPFAYPSLREDLRQAAERSVSDYLAKNRADLKKIEFFEKPIEVTLGDGISINGRIDLVRRLDTNEVRIVDLKSTHRVQTEEVTSTQLHIYALGYQELTGRNADFVESYNLDKGERKTDPVNDTLIDAIKKDVNGAAQALRANKLPARPHKKKCGRCDYQRMCPSAAA